MRGLTAEAPDLDCGRQVADILDRRLLKAAVAPLAVALSGGGDSVALTLMAADWARANRRRLVVLTVDHGLNPAALGWTARCRDLAARLGADFRALTWTGEKPVTGLPAAARSARHRLLAEAAREVGARVILMGHTADDRAEAAAMRADGSSTPEPQEWAPSPAWPQGRGLFLLRPMLGLRRGSLRAWLTGRGESWIEDPANEDPRFARARARVALAGAGAPPRAGARPEGLAALAGQVRDEHGLTLPRMALRAAPIDAARALVGAACLSAAGTARPPAGERLDRLTRALRGDGPVTASLAGARIEADLRDVRWIRQAGDIRRAGSGEMDLEAGEVAVWDGRYEIETDRAIRLGLLAGHAASLSPRARAAVSAWPAAARGGLPMIAGERPRCPLVEPVEGVVLKPLSLDRLLAACGAVDREPA